MANRTIQFDIKAFADTKGLDEFAAQLKELNGTAQASDRILGEAVKAVNEWAKSQKLSADNTASVVGAINALKGAMTAGGSAWKNATQSATQHSNALKEVTSAAMAAKAALASPAATTSGASKQIADMRAGLAGLNIQSEKYVQLLSQINEREALLGRRTGRAAVIAGQQAFEGSLLTKGYGAPESLQEMPNTTAALNQRYQELAQTLPNVIRGTESYFRVAREMSEIERELAKDLTGTTQALRQRSAATQAKIDAVRAYNRDAIAERVAAGTETVAARRRTAFGDVPQAFEQPGGAFIAPPATTSRYGTDFNQYSSPIGPVDPRQFNAAQAAEAQYRQAYERHRQQLIETQLKYNDIEIDNEKEQQRKQDLQRKIDLEKGKKDFEKDLERRQNAKSRQYAFPVGPAAPSELFQSIGGISVAANNANLQLMGRSYRDVAAQIRETSKAAGGSTTALQAERRAWEQLRAAIDPASREYRQATREMKRIDRRTGGGPNRGRFGAFGQSAGAIAAGGFFGGPEGFLGGIAGTVVAGPGGALAGATAGASVGAFRQQLGGIAQYTAQLNLAKITLAQVSANQDEYNKKLDFARTIASDYAVSLETSIRGYARVTAAAQANGLSLKDTQAIYKGLIATGVAFGGSQEDLQAIVTATVQVLSKGKLSAEELSGQLGERLPGAVAAYARANNMSLQELNESLKKGKEGIDGFVKYAREQMNKYDGIAQIIGDSPAKAGERLKLALDVAAENYGGFLQQIGSGFQDNLTKLVSWFNQNEAVVKNWVTLFYNGAAKIGQALDFVIKKAIQSYSVAERATRVLIESTPVGFAFSKAAQFMQITGLGRGFSLKEAINQGGKTPDQLFPKFNPSAGMFGAANGAANNLGNLAADDSKDSDAAARKAANEAAAKERLNMQLYNDQLRREEQMAQNRIKLEDTVFRHRMELMRRASDNQRELDDVRLQNLLGGMVGGPGPAAAVIELFQDLRGLTNSINEERQNLSQAQRNLTSAQQQAAATARTESLLRSDSGVSGEIVGGRSFRGGARSGFTRDRDAEQSGYDVVLPGGVGGPIPSPVGGLRITGSGFQGSGSGPSGRGYGRWVTGRFTGQDGKQYELLIGHLDRLIAKVGDVLERGAIIGTQGETGRTFGTHATTHINALNGGDPWRVLRNEIVQPWIRGWGGGSGATRTLPNGKEARIPGLAGAAGRNISDDGTVQTSEAEVAQQRKLLELAEQRAKVLSPEFIEKYNNAVLSGVREQKQALEDSNKEFEIRNNLIIQGAKPEQIEFEINRARVLREGGRAVEKATEAVNKLTESFGLSEEQAKPFKDTIDKLTKSYQELGEEITKTYEIQNAPGVKLNRRRGELRQALGELGETENAIVSLSESVENGLSNGFSQAVTNIVSGAGTIKDAIANMLQSIAQEFLNYAAKILAKQAVLGILGLFGRGLGGALGGGAGGFAGVFAGSSDFSAGFGITGSLLNANGNAFANGIRPFASGGVVDRPTLFKFANGGAMNTGVMGEAGPEAILPLRRGPNGKLGVQAAPPAPIDVRVETTVINGVEYATVEQLRTATKEAAERGRNMAYAGIQQSVKVRRRLGV